MTDYVTVLQHDGRKKIYKRGPKFVLTPFIIHSNLDPKPSIELNYKYKKNAIPIEKNTV